MSLANNLDSKVIGNRKIIIETRFDPIVSMLDKRGQIVDTVLSSGLINTPHWEVGPSEVNFRDCENRDDARNFVSVRFNRINIMSLQIDSIESYFDRFSKLYEKITGVIGTGVVRRIGCRVMGSYYTKSSSYDTILSNFLKLFPERLQLSKFPANDLLFNLTYTGGMYQIGPLNTVDPFYEREFNNSFCKKHVGVAIDTDNYITNDEKPIDKVSLIKDIYTLSLSVEKDLYTMLSEL